VFDSEVVIVYEDDFINLTNQEEWVFDFAASFHVTPHCDYFTSYVVGVVSCFLANPGKEH